MNMRKKLYPGANSNIDCTLEFCKIKSLKLIVFNHYVIYGRVCG